jgi:hypothetical protein
MPACAATEGGVAAEAVGALGAAAGSWKESEARTERPSARHSPTPTPTVDRVQATPAGDLPPVDE